MARYTEGGGNNWENSEYCQRQGYTDPMNCDRIVRTTDKRV